jgi:nucleoside-diphosphate-sugar epimerase
MEPMTKRLALTGATGFVGSHLLDRLRDREVALLVREERAAAALAGPRRTVVRGGVDDERALVALAEGADVVFHVAGMIAARTEAEFLAANRDGTAAVARACARAGVRRLVYVSSLAVTGPSEAGRPVHDDTRPRPVTPYGRSKLAGEEALRASGVAHAIVRPPVVYGPRDRQILRLFRLAKRGLVPLLGDGTQLLSLIHAADLADALVAAADAPAGRVYHAAHPAIVTQRELAEAIGRAVGRSPRCLPLPAPVVRAALAASGLASRLTRRPTLLDPAKAPELLAAAWTCTADGLARETGWHARVPLAEGLAQTAAWYRGAGWL